MATRRLWVVPADVLRVVDGDTLELRLDLGWRITLTANCRVLGINAPENNTPAGVAARAYALTLLAPGSEVVFHSRQLDKYGRPLGDISYSAGGVVRDFGIEMIAAGHAEPIPR